MSIIQRAIQHMQSGQWDEAIAALQEAPPSFQSYNFLGIACQMSQDWFGAKSAWSNALHYDPHSEDVRLNIGIACVATGDKVEAEEHWSHILKSNPYHVQSLINLGLLYREQQRNQQAHDCWQSALEALPDQPKIIEWLADVKGVLGRELLTLGKVDEAEELLKTAVSMDPTYSMLWGYLSELYTQKGDLSEAMLTCTKACQLEPDNPTFCHMKGNIHRMMGDNQAALQLYKMAVELGGTDEVLFSLIAQLTREEKG